MPADSELRLPHTWRPLGVRLAGTLFGGMLLFACVAFWIAIGPENRDKFGPVERVTLILLGAMFYGAGFALARSRVVADVGRLIVVNGYRRRVFEPAEVVAVRLPPGAPWAVLDLADGTSTSAMGIQGSDGDRARQAVRELRDVLADQSSPGAP